jgi:hypothetical protein
LNNPLGTPLTFEIKDWHFPAFVSDARMTLKVTMAKLAFRAAEGVGLAGVRLAFDGEIIDGFTADNNLGGLPTKLLAAASNRAVKGAHTIVMHATGSSASGPESLSQERVLDVLLYLE